MTEPINLLNAGKTFRDPAVSPEGTRDTEPLPDDIAQRNARLVAEWADTLYDAPPRTSSPGPRSMRRAAWP